MPGINLIPPNDTARLTALHQYRILDSPPESVFDNILTLACQMFDTPAGLISLVDKERVFFKSNYKESFTYLEREKNICSFVVLEEDIVVFEDAAKDIRLQNHPAITDVAQVGFYAGAPLKTKDGFTLGSICIIDLKPRSFNTQNQQLLKSLAAMVMEQIESRLCNIEKDEKSGTIQKLNEELKTTNKKLVETVSQLAKANYELEKSQQLQNDLLEQLRISEMRLLQAMESGNMGTWSIDAEKEIMQLSTRSREIFGLADKNEFSISEVLNVVQPQYQQQVKIA